MQHRKIEQADRGHPRRPAGDRADDENRENEEDLVGAAEQVTPRWSIHGDACAGVDLPDPAAERCQALGLTQMPSTTRAHETAFTRVDRRRRPLRRHHGHLGG